MQPSSVEDRHPDQIAVLGEAEGVALRGGVEVATGRWRAVMQVEHIGLGVVVDAVERDVGYLDADGSRRRRVR